MRSRGTHPAASGLRNQTRLCQTEKCAQIQRQISLLPAIELLRPKTNTIYRTMYLYFLFSLLWDTKAMKTGNKDLKKEKTKSNKNIKTKTKRDSKTKTKRSHVLECAGVGWCDLRQLEAGAPGSRPHLAYQTTAMHHVM